VSAAVISTLLYVIADRLAANLLKAPHLVVELRMGCLLLFANGIHGVQIGALSGFEA